MNSKRKYYILVDSLPAREVFPINDKDIVFSHDKQDEDKAFYERKLKNKLEFSNSPKKGITDFDYFYGYETNVVNRCKEFKIQLYRLCNGEYNLDWQGKFSLNDGEWDLDRCTFIVKPIPDTIYTCLKTNKLKEINILNVPNIISTSTNLDYNYEFFYCAKIGGFCSFPGVQTATWTLFYQDLSYPYTKDCVTVGVSLIVYYREAVITACVAGLPNPPPGSGWLLEQNNCGTSSTCKFVRTPVAGILPFASSCAVGWYNFVTNQDELPPYPTFKEIIVAASPPSEELYYSYPTIIGEKSGFGGIDPEWYMEVLNNPNSTYAWSLTPGSPILAAVTGVTNEVKIVPNSPFNPSGIIQIRLTETHGNASVSIKDYNINFIGIDASNSGQIITSTTRIKGATTVCKNANNLYFEIPKQPVMTASGFYTPTVGPIVWSVTGGAIIVAGQGTRFVTIKAGTANFTVTASYTVNVVHGTTPANNYSWSYALSKAIIVQDLPVTADIDGIIHRYPSEPNLSLKVRIRSANYAWYDSSPAFLSAGAPVLPFNEYFFTTPASIGSHCYLVKETINCACSAWIKVSKPIAVPIPYAYLGFFPPVYWCTGSSISSAINYTRNRSFKEVVEYVIDQLGCNVNAVVSDFFEWNPVGDAPGYSSGINYVTGLTNRLADMTIAQKSDIISYLSSNAATKGMITLDKLEKIWSWMFNAYWFVDAFGRFRVEHISFFNRTVAFDANALPHKPYNIAKNKWIYNKSVMPRLEIFKCAEMMFTDFIGTPIFYDSICVDQDGASNNKERFMDFVTTDLYALYLDPANANKVGFVLMCNDKIGSTYTIDQETGAISGNLIANGHLAWANLHVAYHQYNRVLKQGYMNNILTTFKTTKPTKQQKEIAIKVCCDDTFDPLLQLYKTEIGNGILSDAEENTETGIIKMTLNHAS